MQNKIKDNTNTYTSAADVIHSIGTLCNKKNISQYLNKKENEFISNNTIYIHDKEFFDITLNCCSLSLEHIFKDGICINGIRCEKPKNIFDIFSQLTIFITNIENQISGGLTLVNFDSELAKLIEELDFEFPSSKQLFFHIRSLFQQLNFANSRFGNQSPYVTFTIGITENKNEAIVCEAILKVLEMGASDNKPFIFPNVIFRVKAGINYLKKDKFYNLYIQSLRTTSKQMNPTYILADSEMNKNIDPKYLHTVGCRSRLLSTKSGEHFGIGRTNIGAVSINLPKIAMCSHSVEEFYTEIKEAMAMSFNILLKKQEILKSIKLNHSPILLANNILYPFNLNVEDILEEASLSIGFIGAHECMDILKPNFNNFQKHIFIDNILEYMLKVCSDLSKEFDKIVALIGVSGENLSYHFFKKDKKEKYSKLHASLLNKGYYTNSFHIPVYELMGPIEKLKLEGSHHKFCTGGSISYVEISHNKSNIQGFDDIIKLAKNNNINYLGFNFQKNICNLCGCETDEKTCPNCYSIDILQIRRVSGYLGYLGAFSQGKKIEESLRVRHTGIKKEN